MSRGCTFGYYEAFCGLSATITNAVALWRLATGNSVTALKTAVIVMGVMSFIWRPVGSAFLRRKITGVHYARCEKKIDIKGTFAVFKLPKFYLSCIIIFCCYGFYTCQSFITPYMTNVLGVTVTFAGFLAILKSYGLKLIGAPIGGVLADKMKSVSKFEILAFGVMFVITLYISLVKGGSELASIFTVLTLALATVCFMARGVMWASVDEAKVPKEISGTARLLHP